jgi:hypothetical protein
MSSSVDILTVAVAAFTLFIISYAAFWALSIRHALQLKLYRNHALGVAIVAIGFAVLDIENVLVDASVLVVPTLFLTLFSIFIVMFYWIDSAVLSARRADPLLRDTARWRNLRKPLWIVIVALVVFAVGSSVAGYPGYGGVFIIPFVLVGISGALIVPLATRRSRDLTFNKHMKWFGAFAAIAIAWVFLSFIDTSQAMNPTTLLNSAATTTGIFLADLVDIICLSAAGYCLYKSARSLVPLNRISELVESKAEPPP